MWTQCTDESLNVVHYEENAFRLHESPNVYIYTMDLTYSTWSVHERLKKWSNIYSISVLKWCVSRRSTAFRLRPMLNITESKDGYKFAVSDLSLCTLIFIYGTIYFIHIFMVMNLFHVLFAGRLLLHLSISKTIAEVMLLQVFLSMLIRFFCSWIQSIDVPILRENIVEIIFSW